MIHGPLETLCHELRVRLCRHKMRERFYIVSSLCYPTEKGLRVVGLV